jgi:formylmethanofuran dehydrogenase subunit E
MTARQAARKRDRIARFEIAKAKGYAGFYTCSKCGEFGFAAGKTRERVQCRPCAGATTTEGVTA